jgi:Glycosyl hydrolase family 71
MASKASGLGPFSQMAFILISLALHGCDSSGSSATAQNSAASTAPTATTGQTATARQAAPSGQTPTADPVPDATPAAPPAAAPASSLVTSTNNMDACLPLTMPSADEVFASQKKVFAHYFPALPVSLDNAPPATDYYNTQYLTKNGESGKWLNEGGYLRQRPLGISPNSASNWQLLNMEDEVRAAIARGITGFTFDAMSGGEATEADSPLHLLLTAAQAVDSRFKILVMPDLTALGSDSNAVVQIIAFAATSPAAYRLSDGRLVVSAFDASVNSAAWWQSVIKQLNSKGINVAFVPTFLGWRANAGNFASISYGFGDWGTATPTNADAMQGEPAIAHASYGKIFMTPVDPQQYRPKDFQYWEAGNSAAFRSAWVSSIQGDADWVQLVTWNDFSESSEVSPYTDTTLSRAIGTGFYDLNGYYAAWYLTGQQPQISHDVLYYFYRREPSSASAPGQSRPNALVTGAAEDDIELLAFLTAPAELKITIGGVTQSQNAPAGVVSFKVKSQPGVPLFTLSRNGSDVFSFNGGVQIYGVSGLPSGVQDLTYWSGSAAKSGICSL